MLKPVDVTGAPAAPVGVIVSTLSVDCVRVTGSVAVAVMVTVLPPGVRREPRPPTSAVFVTPGRTMVPDVLRTPVVMIAVVLAPGG